MNRAIAPEINTIKAVNLVFPQRLTLTDEVDLFWIDDVSDETVKIDFIWEAGSKYQPKPLVASFCNQLLFSGNSDISSMQIAEEIDGLGGFLSHEQNYDHAGFSLFGLNHQIEQIFEIASNAFNSVMFPNEEVNKLREIKQKQFELNLEKVNVRARRDFIRKTFGLNHPYGQIADKEDFDRINQKDIEKFYKDLYKTKPFIFLVGKVNDSFINQLKMWVVKFTAEKPIINFGKINQSKGQFYTEKTDALQTAIRIGRPLINKKHADYFKFLVLNTILGGYFGSRLMSNIREDKGYTYGIGSGVAVLEEAAYFFISTEVAKEKREETIKEIFFEINKLKTELISEQELGRVKNYMLGELLRNSDGAIAMMEKFKNIYFNDLKESFYTDFIKTINSCTAEQLKTLSNKYLNDADFTIVGYG